MKPLLLVVLTGCLPFEPPPAAERMAGEYFFADYAWAWTHCASTAATAPDIPARSLTWYRVPLTGGARAFTVDGVTAWGWFHRSSRSVYVADWVVEEPSTLARWVRVHELLHAQTGLEGHPPLFAACRERLFAEGDAP
jgi:hypothetical protein